MRDNVAADHDDNAIARDAQGRFLPGYPSPNPGGRTANVRRVRELLEPKRDALVAKAIKLALAGDTTALRVCLDRLTGTPKPESEAVTIPGLADATTLTAKANCILAATANGSISPDVAKSLLGALADYAKALEVDELQARIAMLESNLYKDIAP